MKDREYWITFGMEGFIKTLTVGSLLFLVISITSLIKYNIVTRETMSTIWLVIIFLWILLLIVGALLNEEKIINRKKKKKFFQNEGRKSNCG